MTVHLLRGTVAAAMLAGLIVFPLAADPFWAFQIGTGALTLGLAALSLVCLFHFVGVVSLAQLAIAGVAGYTAAGLTVGASGVDPWVSAAIGLSAAVLAATVIGAIAARTTGIYLLMLTLALAVGFQAFALQSYGLMGGFNGFAGVKRPMLGPLDFRTPIVFYYAVLTVVACCIAAIYGFERTELGLALQAVRDNPRRVESIGLHVAPLRVIAFGLAGMLAGISGVLNVWLQGRISPGALSMGPTIDVLIVAVLGGIASPAGALVGAFMLRALQVFATDLVGPERVNSLVGLVFLAVVAGSPNGLVGLADSLLRRLVDRPATSNTNGGAGTAAPASDVMIQPRESTS